MKHVVIHHVPGEYFGQAANHGLWRWGNEILVGFSHWYYHNKEFDNCFDRRKGIRTSFFGRSTDGGETWRVEEATALFRTLDRDPKDCPGTMDFTNPDFILAVDPRTKSGRFVLSNDRGWTWQGPYLFPTMGGKPSHRTDYIVNGPSDCFFLLSKMDPNIQSKLKDKAYCARTTDGGKTIQYLAGIAEDPPRSVMPSTVRGSEGQLITALRRRWDVEFRQADLRPHLTEFKSKRQLNWIDVYESRDEGRSWGFISLAAVTDPSGRRNGNPPAMVRMDDGRLCLAFGFRGKPYTIRAKTSTDEGHTWGDEIILRDNAVHWDLGYPRMTQRPDGKLVTIYYIATEDRIEQHMEATIWEP